MRNANTYKVLSFVSFVFHHEGHEIVAQYHAFGFIRVFLDGTKVASKWRLSTSSFILFNIESDLYSVQLEPNDSGTLRRRLERLDSDRALLADMGRRARSTYDAQPTWSEAGKAARDYVIETLDRGGNL